MLAYATPAHAHQAVVTIVVGIVVGSVSVIGLYLACCCRKKWRKRPPPMSEGERATVTQQVKVSISDKAADAAKQKPRGDTHRPKRALHSDV